MPYNESQNDENLILQLNAFTTENKIFRILTAIEDLKNNSIKNLVIDDASMSVKEVEILFVQLKTLEPFTVNINLPKHLENCFCQIELDNLVSNNRLECNKARIGNHSDKSGTQVNVKAIGRILPKGKIAPKIEITLYEEEINKPTAVSEVGSSPKSVTRKYPKIERTPIAEKIVAQILEKTTLVNAKSTWKQITIRKNAQEFRKDLRTALHITKLQDHPLHYLIKDDKTLQEKLKVWTERLKLGIEQYDALLDTFGQYGTTGLVSLFNSWECNNDIFKQKALIDTHQYLLKYMPTYLPFIEDPSFQDTIARIATLTSEKRSWWIALIKNHGETLGYNDLPNLFNCFIDATLAIAEMGLDFPAIDSITYKKDLPTTLSDMLELLRKCPPKDRAIQLACINKVDISKKDDYHLIIPEMNIGAQDFPDLDSLIKSLEISGKANKAGSDLIKTAFYRYIAKQKHHLPIETYQEILSHLFSHKELQNEIPHKMACLLAKTTSTNDDIQFHPQIVLDDWKSFSSRIENLDAMRRLEANRDGPAKFAFNMGITAGGGYTGVRRTAIDPILKLHPLPPMSYLNKLLKLSEYRFLDNQLTIVGMLDVQKEMMKTMDETVRLYEMDPDIMIQAIRLIKTDAVEPNAQNRYFSEKIDVNLMEKFVSTSQIFIEQQYNTAENPAHNPSKILLPLLTTFHLEYEERKHLIENVIKKYNINISGRSNPEYKEKIQALLPYGLSLLQLIKNRKQPQRLNFNTLNKIQEELLRLICQPSPLSKKEIRKWIHDNYGEHYEKNALLDIKDEVNLDEFFANHQCKSPQTQEAIERLISNFDNEEEKELHWELAESLLSLENTLSQDEVTRFFEYCQEAFKTDGLLSRSKQDTPPSYIKQFKLLLDRIASLKSINEFEQYMVVAQKSIAKNNDDRNSLLKCHYFLNIIFPELLSKLTANKDTFNFAAGLVCRSPLQAIKNSHPQVNIILPGASQDKLVKNLRKQINLFKKQDVITPTDLQNLKEKINAIIAFAPNELNLFSNCRNTVDIIDKIITAIDKRSTEYNQNNKVQKAFLFVTKRFTNYNPEATKEEHELLSDDFLDALLSDNSKDYHDIVTLKRVTNTRFQDVVFHLHHKKNDLIAKYNNIAIRINDFINKALQLSPHNITKNHNDCCQLIDDLIEIGEQNLVLSLMYHYSGGLPKRGVKELVALFNSTYYRELTAEVKKDFINAIITQMNNGVTCSQENINDFLKFVHEKQSNGLVKKCLHNFYQSAPFPSLSRFIEWTHDPNTQEATVQELYQKFDKNPCAIIHKGTLHNGREKENGFQRKMALKTLEKMPEVKEIFNNDYLNKIESVAKRAKTLSSQEILDELKKFKDSKLTDHIELVMLTAELLHRCKGRTPEFFGDTQIPGRSYELNTTQIIAILSMFETGKKVTAEIATGEGKTRIMMIINACQFLKGNTVDFVTSNIVLAERDYLESLPFLNSLGSKVNFITASSKIEDYNIGGINVSDPANLCLFRNKAFSQKKSNSVLDPVVEKRALSLDEADVTYFDVSNTLYNYSSTTKQINIDILPIYPLLMEFFAQSETENTYITDKIRCNEQLLAFLEVRNPKLYKLITSLPITQLEKLQDSAYIARHLEYNVDYSIVTNATTPTFWGERKVAAAMCRIGSRVNENARFSEGVHQCLHAEFNRLLKAPSLPQKIKPRLRETLEKCKKNGLTFNIEPEREITYSSSSNTMIQAYDKGSLYAVTGTIGSAMEKQEAHSNFGTKFVKVPRHNGLNRVDRPTRITDNDEAHLDALVTHILDSRAKHQPVLLICKNDNESQDLYERLQQRLSSSPNGGGLPKLTRIHAATNAEDNISEAHYIAEEAGLPGYVTITTDMEGRGTDIELRGLANEAGLKVLLTYLPDGERDYGQIIGRAGRFGKIGESQMVLNLRTLKEDFGINHLNTSFYLNPEAFFTRLQLFATHTKKLHRLFHKSFDDFLADFTKRYEKLNVGHENLTAQWSQFLEQYRLNKDNAYQAILNQLQQAKPNAEQINEKISEHQKKVETLWLEFINQLSPKQVEDNKTVLKAPIPTIKLPVFLSSWLKEIKELQTSKAKFTTIKEAHTVKIYDKYDPAHAGRMHILKNPGFFVKGREWFANFHAWRRREGILFPNLKAWWAGELSLWNYLSQIPFLHLFIKPVEETRYVKIKVPSTYAMLFKEFPKSEETLDIEECDDSIDDDSAKNSEENFVQSIDHTEAYSDSSEHAPYPF